MRSVYNIKFCATGGTPAVLDADGVAPDYLEVKIPSKRNADIEDAYNSSWPVTRDAGNERITISFIAITTHASAAAALAYVKTQRAATAGLLDLQIIVGATTNTYTGCIRASFDPEETTGVSNRIHYTFVGGVES